MKKLFQRIKKGSKLGNHPHQSNNPSSPDDIVKSGEQAERVVNIELGGIIGFGNFNYIFIGYIQTEASNALKSVAVNIPREGKIGKKLDMDKEVSIMKQIGHHEFVLGIIDTIDSDKLAECSFHVDGTFIITDLCANGSLKNYLGRLAVPEGSQTECVGRLRGVPVRIYESVKFAYQIASGMEFIGSKKIVHGDLAARNVLLDERKNCKISDFGMSVEMRTAWEEVGYSREGIGIPWRWVAPECFDSLKYSASSDVWAYGVTVWEIFSIGGCPYGDSKWKREFQEGIVNGSVRLSQPDLADDTFYGLMTACWQTDIPSRPTFSNIVKTLQTQYLEQREGLGAEQIQEIDNIQPSRMAEMRGREPNSTSTKSTVHFEIPLKEWNFGPPKKRVGVHKTFEKSTATIFGRRVHVLTNDGLVDLKMVLNEIKIFRHIGFHPHIVEFVATCTAGIRKGNVYLATELCDKGPLFEYLRENKPRLEENYSDTLKELARFSLEVASALEYLTKKRVVHGSVATRNVFLDSNGNCKLHNFAVSEILQDGYDDDDTQYSKAKERNAFERIMSLRWSSPESLRDLTVSSKSEVWSYGVTVWEIYTLGGIPFEGVTDWMQQIQAGMRLKCPPIAPQAIYDKLLECWNINPEERPSFDKLVEFFADGVRGDYDLKIYECLAPKGVEDEGASEAKIQNLAC